MIVNLPLLLLALLLLWFPRQWLRLGSVLIKRRPRSAGKSQASQEPWHTREPGDLSVDFLTEFSKFRNYVDLIRATAGSVCVVGGLHVEPCLRLGDDATSGQTMGLLVHRRFTFYPPIFFLGGLSVALCEPFGALFAFILIWAFNPVVRNAQGFLTLYAILVLVFGMYFSGLGDKTSMFAGFLCFLPVLLSLLAQRPLVIFARKGRHSTTASTS